MTSRYPMSLLADVCEVFADGDWVESKDQSQAGIRLIQTGNIGIGAFKGRDERARYVSDDTFNRLRCTEIFEGDCLISRLPEPAGRSCIVPATGERMITAVDCTIVRFRPRQVLPEFFNYYSQSLDYLKAVDSETTGTTRKRISRSNLGQVAIPVPPVPEQQRIFGILDEAFAAIATARANTEQSVRNARELFQSQLSAIFAVGGPRWIDKKLGWITTKIGSGATPRGGEESYKSQGIPLIRSLNVHDLGFRYPKLAFLDEAQAHELSNVEVKPRDVLLNITGASVARCCLVPGDVLPARVTQHVSIIRPNSGTLDAGFLHYMLISEPYKRRLLRTGMEGGSTRQAITKAEIQELVVSYPATLEEQETLVARIEEVLTETQDLEAIAQRKLAALDALKQSLLRQAFTGAL